MLYTAKALHEELSGIVLAGWVINHHTLVCVPVTVSLPSVLVLLLVLPKNHCALLTLPPKA